MSAVALFPIPNSVCFPGVPSTLHVFEPRYRQMVRHCLDTELPMGICHTQKVLHAARQGQDPLEALESNQATYKPCEVFSAGPVELLEELADGRLLISVAANVRLKLEEEIQTLPFSIWDCTELHDQDPDAQGMLAIEQYREKIFNRLIALTHGHTELHEQLKSAHWQNMSMQDFGFALAGMMTMEPALAQQLLAMTDTETRLKTLLAFINGAA